MRSTLLLLTPLLLLAGCVNESASYTIDGNTRMRQRPMADLIDTLNAPVPPQTIANTTADRFINTEKMTRFIFRNTVQLNSATNVNPQQAAEFTIYKPILYPIGRIAA